MKGPLAFAARWSDRETGMRLADHLAAWLVSTTWNGRTVQHDMSSAFDAAPNEARRLARAWVARPLRDFVGLRRLLNRRDVLQPAEIVHTGSAAGRAFLGGSEPVILATGHFAREAAIALISPAVAAGHLGQVVIPLARGIRPQALRMALQFGTFLDAHAYLRGGQGQFIFTDRPGAASTAISEILKQRGGKIHVNVDAHWPTGRSTSFSRPFAGQRLRTFSLGPARLARTTQTPIVQCVPYLGPDGRIVLEWCDPILPPSRQDETKDIEITDRLIGSIECAVGIRPDQYVLWIGAQRRWDSARQRWSDRSA